MTQTLLSTDSSGTFDGQRALLPTALPDESYLLIPLPGWEGLGEAEKLCRRAIEIAPKNRRTWAALGWLLHEILAMLIDRRPVGDAGRAHNLASRDLRIVPVVNDLLALLLAQEARLIAHRHRLPIGTSLLAAAHKDSASTG